MQAKQELKVSSQSNWVVGDWVEAKDPKYGKWYASKILEVHPLSDRILVHYHGWHKRHDAWYEGQGDNLRPLKRDFIPILKRKSRTKSNEEIVHREDEIEKPIQKQRVVIQIMKSRDINTQKSGHSEKQVKE